MHAVARCAKIDGLLEWNTIRAPRPSSTNRCAKPAECVSEISCPVGTVMTGCSCYVNSNHDNCHGVIWDTPGRQQCTVEHVQTGSRRRSGRDHRRRNTGGVQAQAICLAATQAVQGYEVQHGMEFTDSIPSEPSARSLEAARGHCTTNGDNCAGITCTYQNFLTRCYLRKGALRAATSAGVFSYIKLGWNVDGADRTRSVIAHTPRKLRSISSSNFTILI